MKWDYEGDYLEQFEAVRRGVVGNFFCNAVRQGCEDVQTILSWIHSDIEHRLERAKHETRYEIEPKSVAMQEQVLRSLDTTEAWNFAQHILNRESLPPDEKAALKTASKATTVWHGDAPTEKQLKYLKALGCVDVPTTKGEASELINQLVNSRQPTVDYDPDSLPF